MNADESRFIRVHLRSSAVPHSAPSDNGFILTRRFIRPCHLAELDQVEGLK
jgi:hypothetical protein